MRRFWRFAIGTLLAPLAGPVVFAVVARLFEPSSSAATVFALYGAAVTYGATALFGVPAYLAIDRSVGVTTRTAATAGAIIGVVTASIGQRVLEFTGFWLTVVLLASAVTGTITGIMFHRIVRER